jgi:hypothetical protein
VTSWAVVAPLKAPVLTLIEKHSGKTRWPVMPAVTGDNLAAVLFKEEVAARRSLLWTDKLPPAARE